MADRDWADERAIPLSGGIAELEPAIATALRAAREEGRPKWQTIDTAPRHQRIIVGRASVSCGRATLPAYSGEAYWSCARQAWCFNSEFFDDLVMEYDNPTHWMPTPTPPGDDK